MPVAVKVCADVSKGQGVFATAAVPKGTLLWKPDQVEAVPADKIASNLAAMPHDQAAVSAHSKLWLTSSKRQACSHRLSGCLRALQELLRQSFVAPSDSGALCINPSDNGRFTNHSSAPNVGACVDHSVDSYALRDIADGEELTCHYADFVTPAWYQQLCSKYGVLTTDEVVKLAAKQS